MGIAGALKELGALDGMCGKIKLCDIPETATLESYVRGKSFEAIAKTNKKVNRALIGAALSIGGNVEIIDFPGYAPVTQNQGLREIAKTAADMVIPERNFVCDTSTSSGSSDIGDLCAVMPVLHPNAAGMTGILHGSDFQIADPEAACFDNAKLQLAMLYLLLKDGGNRAKQIVEEYEPEFKSKEEYMAYMDAMIDSGDRIEYTEDGNAKVRL